MLVNQEYRKFNPFISISAPWRLAIVVYTIFWRILPTSAPYIQTLGWSDGEESVYILAICVLELLRNCLLLLPITKSRFLGEPIGFLHPFVLPFLLGLASFSIKNPGSLLAPLSIIFSEIPPHSFYHPLLVGWSDVDVLEVHLFNSFLELLATISMFLGFYLLRFSVPIIKFVKTKNILSKFIGILLICTLISFYLINLHGGIAESVGSLARGRFRALEEIRHFTLVVQFTPYIFIFWFFLKNQVFRQWYFWLLLIFSCAFVFIITGSRGGTFLPLVALIAAWIVVNRKIPLVKIIAMGGIILVLFGILGDIRTSGLSSKNGQADFSLLTNFDISYAINSTTEEFGGSFSDSAQKRISRGDSLSDRSNETGGRKDSTLGIIAYVPNRVRYLWGETYVGAVTFWVPRIFWKDKPRGVGAYAAAMIWGGRDNAQDYEGGSFPSSGVAEAYWNFSVPGVVLIYLLFGGYRRWLVIFFRTYQDVPIVKVFYILSVALFTSPATPSIVPHLQQIVLLTAIAIWMGSVRLFGKSNRSFISGTNSIY